MTKTAIRRQPSEGRARAALEARRVKVELPAPPQIAIRCRTARDMEHGTHWLWRNGVEYYTPAGLRFLADAYSTEADEAAAVVCRRLADELDAEDRQAVEAHETPGETPEHEAEILAKRWDLKEALK